MATTTRIGAAQDAILGALVTQPALAGVRVTLGAPAGGYAAEHVVVTGGVDDWDQTRVVTGTAAPRAESFRLVVLCVVAQTGDAFAPARDRALELAGAVETAIRDDETLGGAVDIAGIVGGSLDEAAVDSRRYAQVRVVIDCAATITAT